MRQQTCNFALAACAVLGLLAGCADLNDTGMAAFSIRVQAYAVVDEQLVQGEMVLFPDHTGTVAMRAEPMVPSGKAPLTSCVGRLRYASTTIGSIDLRCNEGAVADLRMALIGESRGYGYGQTATGLVSLTFGMTPVEARAHLTVPPGKQLLETAASGGLGLQ
jgi:hypothetical protein